MKKWLFYSLLMTLGLGISGCSDDQKVMDCAKEFVAAFNSGDIEAINKVYPGYKELLCPLVVSARIDAHDSIIVDKNNHYFVYVVGEGEHMSQPYPTQPVLEIILEDGHAKIINSYNCYFPDNKKVKEALGLPTKHVCYQEGDVDALSKRPWSVAPIAIYETPTNDKVISDAYKGIPEAIKIYNTFLSAYKSGSTEQVLKLYPDAAQFNGKYRNIDALSTAIKEIKIYPAESEGTFEYVITSGKTQPMDIPGDIDEVVNYQDVEISPEIVGVKITGSKITDSYNLYDFWSVVPEDKWEQIIRSEYDNMNPDLKRIELVKAFNN